MFGTIVAWRAYAALRGNLAPTTASDASATAALVRASDYIRTRYVLRGGIDPLSSAVEEATYIAASLDLATPGFWSITFTSSQAKILTRVGSLQWTPVGGSGSAMGSDAMLPTSPAIDALLLPLSLWGGPALFVV